MDVISSSTNLSTDLNSADTTTEALETNTRDETIKPNSELDNQGSQEDPAEVSQSINSVENVNSAANDGRTIPNVQNIIVDSVSNKEKPTIKELDSTECATSSVSDSNVCELPKLDLANTNNETEPDTKSDTHTDSVESSSNDDKVVNDESKVTQTNTAESSFNEDKVPNSEDTVLNTGVNLDNEELQKSKTSVAEVTETESVSESTSSTEEKLVLSPKSSEKSEQKSSVDEPNLSVDTEVTSTQDAVEAEEEKMDVDGENKDDAASESALESKISTEQSSESDTSKEKDPQVEESAMEIQNEKVASVTETETNTDDVPESEENQLQTNDGLSEADDQLMDQDLQQENPVFVHVTTKGDNEDNEGKSLNSDADLQNETGDESMEVTCLEEDPIGITQENEKDGLMEFNEEANDKSAIDDELVASKGADEELCIIPDTEREISQEEKDAATAAAAAAAEHPRPKDDLVGTTDTSSTTTARTEDATEKSTEKPTNSAEEIAPTSVDEEFMASVNNATVEVAGKPQIKVIEIPEENTSEHVCHQCCTVKKCVYKVDNNQEKSTFICSETCLISFRTLNKPPVEGLKPPLEGLKLKDIAKKIPGSDVNKIFVRKCAECLEKIKTEDEKVLSWETMDFCNEDCLSRYQNRIGSHCANCKKTVLMSSLGKYCVRFGHDIRQFCCSICLEEFKKGLKVCSYCQKDISGGSEGFLAPVGDKGQFKDFCSQLCMEKYDQMSNKTPNSKFTNSALPIDISQCSVCNIEKQVQVNFDQSSKDKKQKFCSYPCFVAFRFVNQIDPPQCDMCKTFFDNENCTQFSIFYDNFVKNFCCKTCQNIYIIANRRIVPCSWCKVKKYNFDMIKKSCNNGQILMMCSLNCLSLFQVSVNAVSSKKMKCDFCAKVSQAQYHLTMSDATIRNFCTYHCVMSFQSQFAKLPITLGPGEKPMPKPVPVPASGPKKYSNRGARPATVNDAKKFKDLDIKRIQRRVFKLPIMTNDFLANEPKSDIKIKPYKFKLPIITDVRSLANEPMSDIQIEPYDFKLPIITDVRSLANEPMSDTDTDPVNEVRMPVITNVESLANNGTAALPRTTQIVTNAVKINNQQQNSPQPPTSPKLQVKQQIIVKAPPLPPMKNAATQCKPILHTKGVSCRPHPCSKETQTEEIKEKTVLIPVPVPIYVPAPMSMFSAPVPVPIPFPVPIPIPIFIPTTRNSAAGIMKEIKKIQVKIPTDPFEAELLMMAEMVAGEKKVDNTDSESEEDDNGDTGNDGGFSPEAVDTSNTFGDDMLQMALKMATELDEPAVDLEGALTANTITASQNQDNPGTVVATEETVDDPQQPMHQLIDRQNIPIRGRKRTNRPTRNMSTPAKRSRRMSSHVEIPLLPAPQPSQPTEPIEKPDANMCLKYTFGVNAWKQWVTTKNTELEKSSRRVKLFKNEILQLTADELNYSLCLFVKEVRKPNGTEYAPDTIYYLCLGIQQYLFENGRIDNIFTDAYYEKFTDCLDEVARKFSVLYNDSHYIVTRVEEEHLWESKQLGAHSPHVLLSTLMFFNTKHFNLTTVDEHMQLSFSHIMKHWKRNPNQPGAAKIPGSRNVLLRFYPPQTTLDSNSRKKKVYEQQENEENPLRCPVKLYEFYLSKCPESVKTRNDVFYLLPERSCVPDSPVWYSTMALGREALEKMLHRVKMVKEINVALLTS